MSIIKFILLLIIFSISACRTALIRVKTSADNNAYTMFGKTPERIFFVNAVLSDSLRLKWESSTAGSFYTNSVTVTDSLVFVGDLAGELSCFNIFNGKKIGSLKYKDAVVSSALIKDFLIVFSVASSKKGNSKIIYYDYYSGKTFKEIEIEDIIFTPMLKIDNYILAVTTNGNIYKLDFQGNLLSKIKTNNRTGCLPSAFNDFIFFGTDDGKVLSVNYKTGKVVYEKSLSKFPFNSSVVISGKIILTNDDGYVYALNISDGEIKWQFNTGSRIVVAVASDFKNIFFGNLKGTFYSLNINNGQLNWQLQTDGLFNSTALVIGKKIIVPDLNKKIRLINSDNGKIIKTIYFDGRVKLSPVFTKNLLFVGYDEGNLAAYEFVQ